MKFHEFDGPHTVSLSQTAGSRPAVLPRCACLQRTCVGGLKRCKHALLGYRCGWHALIGAQTVGCCATAGARRHCSGSAGLASEQQGSASQPARGLSTARQQPDQQTEPALSLGQAACMLLFLLFRPFLACKVGDNVVLQSGAEGGCAAILGLKNGQESVPVSKRYKSSTAASNRDTWAAAAVVAGEAQTGAESRQAVQRTGHVGSSSVSGMASRAGQWGSVVQLQLSTCQSRRRRSISGTGAAAGIQHKTGPK